MTVRWPQEILKLHFDNIPVIDVFKSWGITKALAALMSGNFQLYHGSSSRWQNIPETCNKPFYILVGDYGLLYVDGVWKSTAACNSSYFCELFYSGLSAKLVWSLLIWNILITSDLGCIQEPTVGRQLQLVSILWVLQQKVVPDRGGRKIQDARTLLQVLTGRKENKVAYSLICI